jgi:hypothetical protein
LPWQRPARQHGGHPAAEALETFFRRLPLVIRQLRQRWGTRPPFRVEDEHDLEDLVRSLLPLHFDEVHPRSRTPSYSADTRTDYLINPGGSICTVKHTSPVSRQTQLEQQLQEDVAYYRSAVECRSLWVYIFDPQGHLHEPGNLEAVWSRADGESRVRCVISG